MKNYVGWTIKDGPSRKNVPIKKRWTHTERIDQYRKNRPIQKRWTNTERMDPEKIMDPSRKGRPIEIILPAVRQLIKTVILIKDELLTTSCS